MTETGMNLSNPLHGERRVGAVGLPLPGVSARIVDPVSEAPLPDGEIGEVQIKGAHVFKGYWRQPEKTADAFSADGWLRTGDLGLREPDGYYTLKGRAKDLIITGGLNVYPPEVELALMEHPAVAACAVIGCPDDEWGESVVAAIILRAGEPADGAGICAFCRERLAAYKVPRRVVFVDELPSNAAGQGPEGQAARAPLRLMPRILSSLLKTATGTIGSSARVLKGSDRIWLFKKQFISAERFQDLVNAPEYQDRVLELVEGVIIEMPKPKRIHGVVTMRLALRNRHVS